MNDHNLAARQSLSWSCLKSLAAVCVLALPAMAVAGEPPLICFGNEPSWSVNLTEPGTAVFMTPDTEAIPYSGAGTRNEVLKESVWRGTPEDGGDLVVFLRGAACSDTMSDTVHPVVARVSTSEGRFLAGCCRFPATEAASSNKTLESVSWRLSSLAGETPPVSTTMARPIIARFEAGRVSGFSGCNNFMGSYAVEDDVLTFGPLAGTMMACAEPDMAIESAFRAALSDTTRYSISADQLELFSESGSGLTFTAEPPPRLDGVVWEVTDYNNGRQAVVSPLIDTGITLSFEQGIVSGHAGCNSFRAPYSTEGNRIEIGLVGSTMMACPEEQMAQEQEFLAALQSTVKWKLDGNILDMHRADGERTIMATSKEH